MFFFWLIHQLNPPEAQNDVIKCLILSITQNYSSTVIAGENFVFFLKKKKKKEIDEAFNLKVDNVWLLQL